MIAQPHAADACRAAQALARNHGYACFPCRWDDKTPVRPAREGGRGCHDASNDPDVIAWLWQHWPGSLVGIATGTASGISVLDIDPDHQPARTWWHANLYRLPQTAAYRTRRQGLHLYFEHADGIRNKQGSPVLGVDVRGDGGFVISWHAAGLPCLDDAPPAPFPNWLRTAIWPPRPAPPPARNDASPRSINGLIQTVAQAVEGCRNGKLYWAANRMRDAGFGQRDAERELLRAALASGLPELEARRTIRSAWRA